MNTIEHLENLLHKNRQLKKLFFDDKEKLKPEAVFYFNWMREFCYANRPAYKQNPTTGAIDPYATHVVAGRQEVWIEHEKRLHLDTIAITNQLNELKQEELWSIQQPRQ